MAYTPRLIARDVTGAVIQPGDILLDLQGLAWLFKIATRMATPDLPGRVLVGFPSNPNSFGREFDESVFQVNVSPNSEYEGE
jgi:hypothetical protein